MIEDALNYYVFKGETAEKIYIDNRVINNRLQTLPGMGQSSSE